MESRYSDEFETREECERYVAKVRGYESREAMLKRFQTCEDDPNHDYQRRLRRIRKASK